MQHGRRSGGLSTMDGAQRVRGAAALALVSCLCWAPMATLALDNGVGKTPAMGWNSWNFFRCAINETIIKQVADAIVASGLRDAGYKYVNIDDCWMERRGVGGRIEPFRDKFPSGMKALGDYIHSKGLLFGVYSDAGNSTCEGYPGSWGYERLDAETYAEWGVDYLKFDYCNMQDAHETVQASYERMRDALLATKRPILFSLCSWGSGAPWEWGSKVGNSWRAGIDTFAVWDAATAAKLQLPSFLQPILGALKAVEGLAQYAGPGGFNDPDMLVVGLDGMYPYGVVQTCPEHVKGCKPGDYISRERWGKVGGLTVTEQRTHFALWCMVAAPLILGNDPRRMSKTTLSILTAPEVLAISQDPLGKQATKVWSDKDLSIWVKPLSGGRWAALLFNAGERAADLTLSFKRDLAEGSKPWEREVTGLEPACEDSLPGCKGWAQSGECLKNPGFMLNKCMASCPNACPKAAGPPGPKATAMVRDAWAEDDLGPHAAEYTAHLVEPHEARLLVLRFVEPAEAAAWRHRITPLLRVQAAAEGAGGSGGGAGDAAAAVMRQLSEANSKAAHLEEVALRSAQRVDACRKEVSVLEAQYSTCQDDLVDLQLKQRAGADAEEAAEAAALSRQRLLQSSSSAARGGKPLLLLGGAGRALAASGGAAGSPIAMLLAANAMLLLGLGVLLVRRSMAGAGRKAPGLHTS